MQFQERYEHFLKHHTENRSGERLGRLIRGHGHAEKLFLQSVWFPLFGNFEHLHPEYEILDWRGRSYFADFVWSKNGIKILIEIKGFATHVRDMDRQKYSNELNRETFLTAMGYSVISFSYDNVEQQPELSISLLRMVLSRFQANAVSLSRPLADEKEVLRLAFQLSRAIRVKDIMNHFQVADKTARLLLKRLCDKGHLRSCRTEKTQRVHHYELSPNSYKHL